MLVEETYDIVQFHLTNGLEVRPSDLGKELLGFLHPIHGFLGFLRVPVIGAGSQRLVDLLTCPFNFWVINLLGNFIQPRQLSRSEEHTSELQSLMRISYAVFCL